MKRLLAAMTAALMMVGLLAGPTLAAKPTNDLMGQAWRVYNVMPATSSYWDINKLAANGTFPIQQFVDTTHGSFAVYVLNNYNVSLKTSQTLSADLAWTAGTYKTRSTVCSGAYVRFEFQDVTAGPYNSNDYWWSTVNLDLNALPSSGTLTASLTDRTLWTNQNGMLATDMTTDWTDWTGATVAMSPYDGFTNAMKNVKQLGLSLGSSCTYASGVALVGGPGTFTMSSFTITP